jgi:hypothetical protein
MRGSPPCEAVPHVLEVPHELLVEAAFELRQGARDEQLPGAVNTVPVYPLSRRTRFASRRLPTGKLVNVEVAGLHTVQGERSLLPSCDARFPFGLPRLVEGLRVRQPGSGSSLAMAATAVVHGGVAPRPDERRQCSRWASRPRAHGLAFR